ncbi:hypothetical protein G7075_01945 [Phycicoccus sp. HDW14]|uniref:hypothetical protein n=1 Tax=Phycicoccus sp. HDW14 TaxID=2714941 RepID=UPI00140D7E6D|nr:hypothetical protein [Phycicoccus sp. HDW14]QIM20197.1 hypothetical protein G7075_01945 [Phycicoccus sp. HDW14]
MGRHSARRRRAPLGAVAGVAAVLAAGGFATTLVDGSQVVPRASTAPDDSSTPTTTDAVPTATSTRGDGLNKASRSFTRTAPPSPTRAPAGGAGRPSSTPSPSVSPSASPSAARSASPTPSATPSATPRASPSPTATPPTTAPTTPTPTPTRSLLDLLPGVVGGHLR